MNASNVVDLSKRFTAVSDATATATPCGAIVWWALSGTCTVQGLSEALATAGSLAIPPERPSQKVVMHRACVAVARTADLDVAIVKGGYALTRRPVEEDDGLVHELRSTIVATAKTGSGYDGIPDVCDALRAAAATEKETLSASDVSAWLCSRLENLGAVALRERGGVYFIPEDATRRFEKVCKALAAATSHRVYTVPALRTESAVEAILAALEQDTQKSVDAIAAAVASGEIGSKGLATKEKELATLVGRLSRYEELLGRKLDAVRAKADEAARATAVAMLAASPGET
jgi:hypothetical protein